MAFNTDNSRTFARFYGRYMKQFVWAKRGAHVLNFLFSLLSVKTFMESSTISHAFGVWLSVASLSIGAFVAIWIEKLIDSNVSIWEVQKVKGYSGEYWSKMKRPITVLALFGLFLSPVLSFMGATLLGEKTAPEFEYTDITELKREYDGKKYRERQTFGADRAEIKERYKGLADAEKGRYAGLISEWRNYRKKYNRLKDAGNGWAQGYIDKADASIKDLESDLSIALAELEKQKASELSGIDKRESEAVTMISAEYQREKAKIEEGDERNKGITETVKGLYFYFLVFLGLASSGFLWFYYHLAAIYFHGAGKELPEEEADPDRTVIERAFSIAGKAVNARANRFLDGLEKKIDAEPRASSASVPSSGSYARDPEGGFFFRANAVTESDLQTSANDPAGVMQTSANDPAGSVEAPANGPTNDYAQTSQTQVETGIHAINENPNEKVNEEARAAFEAARQALEDERRKIREEAEARKAEAEKDRLRAEAKKENPAPSGPAVEVIDGKVKFYHKNRQTGKWEWKDRRSVTGSKSRYAHSVLNIETELNHARRRTSVFRDTNKWSDDVLAKHIRSLEKKLSGHTENLNYWTRALQMIDEMEK